MAERGVDLKRAKAHKFEPRVTEVNARNLCLYALGVGCDPVSGNADDLKFVYEGHEEFSAIPSYGVVPAMSSMGQIMGIDGLRFNPMMLLHGEQYIEFVRPIPTEGELTSLASLVDILDKGKGAVVVLQIDTKDAEGRLVFTNQSSIFIRGIGGFGGPSSNPKIKMPVETPAGPPDAVVRETTSPTQAILYRLSGDLNPLHIDPNMAAVGGFERPILHGLCSFGYATRHVMRRYAANDPARIAAIKVRFSSPVYPGETLETSMWLRGSRVHFVVKVPERGVTVVSGAYVDLVPEGAGSANAASEAPKATAIFAELAKTLDADMVKKVGAVYQWNVTGPGGKTLGQWALDLKNGSGSLYEGPSKGTAGCTLTLSEDTLAGLMDGSLDAMKAYMGGKLKVTGNIMLSQKLQVLFKAGKKGAADGKGQKSGASASPPLKAEVIFDGIAKKLNAELVKKVNAVYQWNITKGGKQVGQWTVDLQTGSGSVYKGLAKTKPGCTITLDDDTLEALSQNKLDAVKAFMSGSLKVSGNVALAQKLQLIFKDSKL